MEREEIKDLVIEIVKALRSETTSVGIACAPERSPEQERAYAIQGVCRTLEVTSYGPNKLLEGFREKLNKLVNETLLDLIG